MWNNTLKLFQNNFISHVTTALVDLSSHVITYTQNTLVHALHNSFVRADSLKLSNYTDSPPKSLFTSLQISSQNFPA